MRILKDKRGIDLRQEVPGIVVAVIALMIIGGFIYVVYNVFAHQEEKAAQGIADSVEAKINAVSKGDEGRFTIQGISVKDKTKPWYFVQFDKSSSYRPDRCYFSSCVCMCRIENKPFFSTLRTDALNLLGFGEVIGEENLQTLKNSCQNDGFCREVEGNLYYFTLIQMDSKLFEFVVKKKGDTTCLTCTICEPFNNCDEMV